MPIYKQTTEITKIDDVWANIDRDIVEVYFGDKNIFTVWGEYDSSLPITIRANGDALIDYRIDGSAGGVGEVTENIYSGYIKQGYYDFSNGDYNAPGTTHVALRWVCTDLIPCAMNTDYAIRMQLEQNLLSRYYGFVFFDENQNFLRSSTKAVLKNPITFVANTGNAKYMAFDAAGTTNSTEITPEDIVNFTLTEGSTAPTSYIPYGYKLPMTVSDGNTAQTVPVYIGENQLGEDEYVSFSEQKIYRNVSGTLTPTDPPVPLPEIPTIKGETVIDYDGDPKPSQMYIKYRKQHS